MIEKIHATKKIPNVGKVSCLPCCPIIKPDHGKTKIPGSEWGQVPPRAKLWFVGTEM